MSTTIRVSERTRDRLATLADSTGLPMTRLVDDAVEALERKLFFEKFNQRYEILRADQPTWSDIEDERADEQSAVGDSSS